MFLHETVSQNVLKNKTSVIPLQKPIQRPASVVQCHFIPLFQEGLRGAFSGVLGSRSEKINKEEATL